MNGDSLNKLNYASVIVADNGRAWEVTKTRYRPSRPHRRGAWSGSAVVDFGRGRSDDELSAFTLVWVLPLVFT